MRKQSNLCKQQEVFPQNKISHLAMEQFLAISRQMWNFERVYLPSVSWIAASNHSTLSAFRRLCNDLFLFPFFLLTIRLVLFVLMVYFTGLAISMAYTFYPFTTAFPIHFYHWPFPQNDRPIAGMKNHPEIGRQSYSLSLFRISTRLIFPLTVLGSSSTKSTTRGYL